jgi:hypothetical protein
VIVTHVSPPAGPGERGEEFGAAQADAIAATVSLDVPAGALRAHAGGPCDAGAARHVAATATPTNGPATAAPATEGTAA